jgi:hypothetical protein
VTLAARRRLALVLVVLLTAATVAAWVLVRSGGSEPDSNLPSDVANCSDTVKVESDAFNFSDAVACGPSGQRRANARERPGPPE